MQEREEIRVGLDRGESFAAIGQRLGRPRQTISREVNRNGGREAYRAFRAEDRAARCARRRRVSWVEQRPWLYEVVWERLTKQLWSPEQIAKWLRVEHPEDPDWWVSHETIYKTLYVQAKGQLRKEVAMCLRTGRVRRKPRNRQHSGVGRIPDMINISERPPEVEDRAVPGHWEGDLIEGARNKSFVATLVERTTRYGMLIKLENKTAEHVAERLAEAISRLPVELARSLTWDQGSELSDHQRFTVDTNVPVYFCDPRSPWQRGTNENWNGLVRQYLPKGTDLSVWPQDQLDAIARQINGRPRKTLEWKTPAQTFTALVTTTA